MGPPSIADFKALVLIRRWANLSLGVGNAMLHAFGQLVFQQVEFARGSFGNQLHSSVGQVSHKAGHGQSTRNRLGGVAKAYALYLAGEVNFAKFWHCLLPKDNLAMYVFPSYFSRVSAVGEVHLDGQAENQLNAGS
ncbi:hypothetical protein Pan181_34110 [Aeoliella mucimassa]|uniref:Uncharacterized protein n=1 Tax=Aeoliella mucimassa TaxID=2527972 RepID=A0A518AR48_9BACT|nr:hypothetical protein Pan181_34110 [Aeoliella mucimassa]